MNTELGLPIKAHKNGRPLFLRTEMDRLLSLSILFSCLLVVMRMIHTGRLTFLFLVWNLFLAYIPYFITEWLASRGCMFPQKCLPRTKYLFRNEYPQQGGTATDSAQKAGERRTGAQGGNASRKGIGMFLFVILFLVWLLFIPNSFYIITDLYHLGDHYNDRQAPQWFDLAMILSFVWNGLLLGILSVRQMEKILQPLLNARNDFFFLYPVMWLNALGVYTGRYLRYNSWDLVTDPFQLLEDIVAMIIHPFRYHNAWDMIFCFSILMTLMYLMLKRISKALA